ncbi:M28 family peptidase [Paenibacillus phoenicis]|uniref:M28 family peptidase n=1 Tax=Paenibacillus TaxID=44249 RepID=UPI003D2A5564
MYSPQPFYVFHFTGFRSLHKLFYRLLVGNPSSPLISALNTYMTKRGISSTTEGTYGGSDHLSFLESGFEAVTITQENIQGFHTTDDTPDHLDFKAA